VEATYEGTLAVRGGVSADGALLVERLNYKDVKIGPARLAVSVHNGVAQLTLQDAELYGGRANGNLLLDGTGPAPAVAANLNFTGLSMLPLLTDVAGIAWLDGRATLTLALNGQGRSERQIVETLQGQIKVSVADGALAGVDVEKTVRALQRGRLGDLALRREDRTPFSEIAGTFDVANGVAKNQDLKLVSTHAELKGEGLIELVPRRIDYTLHTKISAGAPNRDAVVNIGTLEFPIAIKGRLERPKFTIKGQDGLTDALKQIGRNLRSREVRDALKGLLGGNGEKRVEPGD
jgi:AsmA protein